MHVFAALSLLALREGGGGGLQQEKFIGCFCGRVRDRVQVKVGEGRKSEVVGAPFSQAVCGR
jgi:hypothetical protein